MSSTNFEPGQTISHFRIEKMLGEGGMGAVYLAEDLTLSRRVAIKFMHRQLLVQQGNESAREGLEKRFIREAKSAAALNHPNLAQIYEANFDTDSWFIAMEFIDGASLFDSLTAGKQFSVSDVVSICQQTISGLEFAWEKNSIIHRDIKPHNIMLTKSRLVKIVDLGLAKPVASGDTEFAVPDLTCVGTPIGTPQYMAPEQATGQKDVNFMADIFALGATLYEVYTGQKTFSGNTAPMIYMAQLQKKYTPIGELKKDTPQELIDLIDAMLEPKQEDRIDSYKKIADALNELTIEPAGSRPKSIRPKTINVNRPKSTYSDQLSGKTIGIEQYSIFHPADMLIKDRYRILKSIGKSRAGMVYHCLDTRLSVECAVKSLFPGREYPEQEMPRIIENFQRLMGLSHPNLVQIRDLQIDDETGEFFIVMELLSGRNLREYTHRLNNEVNGVEIQSILPVLQIVGKALDNIGKTFNVIHHDLLPENIYLFKNDSQVKFLDYGITYPSSESPYTINPNEKYLYPLASPDYMAPEIWNRKSPTRQADQYTLAVIIYEILSEKLPFWLKDPLPESYEENKETQSKIKTSQLDLQLKYLYDRVIKTPPPSIPSLKRYENMALEKALSKDPHDRFASCDEFINRLEKSKSGFIETKVLAIAAIAVILVTMAIWFFNPSDRDQKERESGVDKQISQETSIEEDPNTGKDDFKAINEDKKVDRKFSRDNEKQRIEMAATKLERQDKNKAEQLTSRKEAIDQKQSYTQYRKSNLEKSLTPDLLEEIDKIAKKAEEHFSQGKFHKSILQYKKAKATGKGFIETNKANKANEFIK